MEKNPSRRFVKAARGALQTRFPTDETEEILRQAEAHYRGFSASLPHERTVGARLSVRWAAFNAALFRTLVERGVAKEEALELAFEATWQVQAKAAGPINRLTGLLTRDPLKAAGLAAQLSHRTIFRPPGWIREDVPVTDGFGFDMTRCPFSDYLRPLGLGELCERTICNTDFRAAEARGVKLTRTGTLAGGAARCDFRFTRKE
jgi:hypothetical protein